MQSIPLILERFSVFYSAFKLVSGSKEFWDSLLYFFPSRIGQTSITKNSFWQKKNKKKHNSNKKTLLNLKMMIRWILLLENTVNITNKLDISRCLILGYVLNKPGTLHEINLSFPHEVLCSHWVRPFDEVFSGCLMPENNLKENEWKAASEVSSESGSSRKECLWWIISADISEE